jgi:hypothetical protein
VDGDTGADALEGALPDGCVELELPVRSTCTKDKFGSPVLATRMSTCAASGPSPTMPIISFMDKIASGSAISAVKPKKERRAATFSTIDMAIQTRDVEQPAPTLILLYMYEYKSQNEESERRVRMKIH